MMKIRCKYCNSYIEDTEEFCKICGADNPNFHKNFSGVPKTIEELQEWYKIHKLPDEYITRFFIGKNYTGARAFGIYKDTENNNFIVYKNKSDGSRAIRYNGKDEAFAVNELYIKLKDEILNQKQNNITSNYNITKQVPLCSYGSAIFFVIFLVVFLAMWIYTSKLPSRGYYLYNDNYYYYQNGSWYQYKNSSGWRNSNVPSHLKDNCSDYYKSNYYYSSYGIDDFSDSIYYEPPSSSSSSSYDDDDDYDWDSGSSWDSSSTDWDSDW